jgi:hypothetical protein
MAFCYWNYWEDIAWGMTKWEALGSTLNVLDRSGYTVDAIAVMRRSRADRVQSYYVRVNGSFWYRLLYTQRGIVLYVCLKYENISPHPHAIYSNVASVPRL